MIQFELEQSVNQRTCELISFCGNQRTCELISFCGNQQTCELISFCGYQRIPIKKQSELRNDIYIF